MWLPDYSDILDADVFSIAMVKCKDIVFDCNILYTHRCLPFVVHNILCQYFLVTHNRHLSLDLKD